MRHSYELDFIELRGELERIEKSMKKHRERMIKIKNSENEIGHDIAMKLLENSMASVGSIERDAGLLLRTYQSATANYPSLRR